MATNFFFPKTSLTSALADLVTPRLSRCDWFIYIAPTDPDVNSSWSDFVEPLNAWYGRIPAIAWTMPTIVGTPAFAMTEDTDFVGWVNSDPVDFDFYGFGLVDPLDTNFFMWLPTGTAGSPRVIAPGQGLTVVDKKVYLGFGTPPP